MNKERNFCYTLNNYTEEDIKDIKNKLEERCKYAVIGKEIGEEGTPHLQGYFEFKHVHTFAAVKKLFPKMHFEIRKGTASEASLYCKKEDPDYWEFGTLKGQGKRCDLIIIKDKIIEGNTNMRKLIPEMKNLQQIKCAETLLKYYEPSRNWKTEVTWIYGKTGSGKTRLADETLPEAYWKDSTKWWEGYDGHKFVIIDDFRDSQWRFEDLLRLLDRYAYRVETKGGSRQLLCTHITITCPFPPEDCYKSSGEDINQLLRRISTILKCNDYCTKVKG